MAINEDQRSGFNAKATENAQQAVPPVGATVNNAGAMPWDFRTSGTYAAPIAKNSGGEFMNGLMEGLTDLFKGTSKDIEIRVMPFNRDDYPSFYFSVLVITMRYLNDDTSALAYYTLVLEKTNNPPESVTKSDGNKQVVYTKLASDAYDSTMQQIIKTRLKELFKSNVPVPVDSMVIPRDFDIKDPTLIESVGVNAGLACGTELAARRSNFHDINIAQMGQNSNLTIFVNYGRQQQKDIVALPVRSDLRTIFKVQNQQGRNNDLSLNSQDSSMTLAEISSFVDLVWVGEEVNVYNPYQPIRQNNQNYAARLVITDIDNLRGYTPGSLLLAIATVEAISHDNNWILAFRPQSMDRNTIDIGDIGALGYENNFTADKANYGKRVDTKSGNFDTQNLSTLISSLIKPGIMISMDVPESGPQTWYTSLFNQASTGNGNAITLLMNAANSLTNGRFGSKFSGTPFVDTDNRIHLGYYYSKNGEKKDIRDIDYLAVANLVGEKEPNKIRDWSDTFTRSDFSLAMRLAERKRIIDELTSGTAVYTGFARRVTFSVAFIEALVSGCREAGLSVNVNTPLSASEFNNARGVGNFVSEALVGKMSQGFIHANPMYQGFAGQPMGNNTSRW
jgi:hypothetical protein